MISGVLTLFNWTLRMDSKSVYPHVVRVVFAVAMLMAVTMTFVDVFGVSSMGLRFFESVCSLNVLIISVSGISYFVTAVTEEKDAGTYPLLRLAGMNALAIVLGKSTSRLVSSLMLLVIQVPFTFLAITLGGVLWNQIIAAYLAMAAWMIFVANMSLFCSVRCSTSGRAAGLAATILLLFIFLPRIAWIAQGTFGPGVISPAVSRVIEATSTALSGLSIYERLNDVFMSTQAFTLLGVPLSLDPGNQSPGWFMRNAGATGVGLLSVQFWGNLLLAAVFFVFSVLALHFQSAQADAGPAEVSGPRRRSGGRVWSYPVAWKEFRFFAGGGSFTLVKFLFGAMVYGAMVYYQWQAGFRFWILKSDYAWTAFVLFVCALTAEVLLYSAGCLFFEVRQQTLSTLAAVPISPVRVLSEKFFGCLIAVTPSIFWILFTGVLSRQAISANCSFIDVVSYIIMLCFSSHVAVLLSLYTRWAALPLTILLTVPAMTCLAGPIMGMTGVTTTVAATHNWRIGPELSIVINLFWTWLFVLFPIQIWIRDRWISLSCS